MKWPWRKQEPEEHLQTERQVVAKLQDQRKEAAREVEKTLQKILDMKEPRNGTG